MITLVRLRPLTQTITIKCLIVKYCLWLEIKSRRHSSLFFTEVNNIPLQKKRPIKANQQDGWKTKVYHSYVIFYQPISDIFTYILFYAILGEIQDNSKKDKNQPQNYIWKIEEKSRKEKTDNKYHVRVFFHLYNGSACVDLFKWWHDENKETLQLDQCNYEINKRKFSVQQLAIYEVNYYKVQSVWWCSDWLSRLFRGRVKTWYFMTWLLKTVDT